MRKTARLLKPLGRGRPAPARRAAAQVVSRFAFLTRRVAERFIEDRCTRAAESLSFTTLFALVPLMAVGLATLSIFPLFHRLRETIKDFIYGNFVPAAGDVVEGYIDQFIANAGQLTIWGLLFVLAAAFLLMLTVERALNDIWRIRETRTRLHRLLAFWGLLTLGPLLIAVSLAMTTQLASLPVFAGVAALGGLRGALFNLLPIALEVAAFTLLYAVVPNATVRLRHALTGAVFAALLFEIAKRGFGWYISQFSSYRVIYGAVAALPVFLLWIYLSWLVVLLGAVVTATLPEVQTRPRRLRDSGA